MEKITGKVFKGQRVNIDGRHFSNCKFENCTLVFAGKDVFSFDGNDLNTTTIEFDGAAGRTLAALQALAEPGSGFSEIVKQSFPKLFAV
ncbi:MULTISPECIES: hypothetical protein [unclassified Beijerinckia]|uniref:hypothetical protein n=1 Tax=unclassified Beijerinckia TaxID=2638183 RepID=UPI00089D2D8B|nr:MULTISPECIES: hypothetical protein [unclassified Beijerinckia]MDH7795246.1 hypothetical protein [Beijerinckia sp. GAS462]SEB93524.1 hypothetical protein SAMN05443249_1519 [Beijerinckia sp. 28-YEA-48]